MELRDLIAQLESIQANQDELTLRLIEELKEHDAALEDMLGLQRRHIAQRGAASSVVVEAAFAARDIERRAGGAP